MHPAWLAVADDPRAADGSGGFQSERPVRTMGVVVGGVGPQDLLQVASPDDQQPVHARVSGWVFLPFRPADDQPTVANGGHRPGMV
jgi:hypothetical protein